MRHLVNLCPHDVTIYRKDRSVLIVYPKEGLARAQQWTERQPSIEADGVSIPSVGKVFGDPIGLPEPQADLGYIVSLLTVRSAHACGRSVDDLFITAEPVRDEKTGAQIGCSALMPGPLALRQ